LEGLVASDVYTNAKFLLAKGTLGWIDTAEVFRALLVSSTYTYNAAHVSVADVLAFEVSGNNYSRIDVTNRAAAIDVSGDRALLDADDLVFEEVDVTGLVGGVIIYKRFGMDDSTPLSDPLVCFLSVTPVSLSGGDGVRFKVRFDTDGVVALTTS
jgi:hypothetical protein